MNSDDAARLVINSIRKVVKKGDLEEARHLLENKDIQETLSSYHVTNYEDFMIVPVTGLLNKVEEFSYGIRDVVENYNQLVLDYQDALFICQSLCMPGSLTILKQVYDGLMKIRGVLVGSLLVPETTILYRTLTDSNLPF